MRILITGDSHCGALYRGLVQLQNNKKTSPSVEIVVRPIGGGHLLPTPFFRDAGDHADMTAPLYRRNLSRLPPVAPDFDAVVLSMPLWPMRLLHQMTWGGFSLGEYLANRKTVSHQTFRLMVLEDQKYILKLIELLSRNGIRLAAVSPPRLFRDHPTLKHLPARQAQACFNAYLDTIKAELSARNVAVIELPDRVSDEEGFMLQKYRHEDPEDGHHANADFGALMIAEIDRWACSKAATTSKRPGLSWFGKRA